MFGIKFKWDGNAEGTYPREKDDVWVEYTHILPTHDIGDPYRGADVR